MSALIFEGVGVSYFCRRDKDTFTVRHVMAQVAKGSLSTAKWERS
jgi:hypothetical protein